MTLARGEAVKLRGDGGFSLVLIHNYRIVEDPRGPWTCLTAGYHYALKDERGREVLLYHWHPEAYSPVTWPHLHLGEGSGFGRQELLEAHLPTGHVSVQEVLRLAISELGVEPRREGWAEILEQTQGAYERWRTWPASQGWP